MPRKFLIISVILLAAYFLISVPSVQKKFLYPFPYRPTVEKYSARWQVDKFLSIAVMKVESNFSESANSQSGAVGLMQIMPETAAWIAYRLGETPEEISADIKNLREPETNIRYGTWYLAELEQEFKGNDVLALAAYNAGRGNVYDWMWKKITGTKIFPTWIKFPTPRLAITLSASSTAARNTPNFTANRNLSQRRWHFTNCALSA